MYFKITKETDSFKKLDEINNRRIAAIDAALDFARQYNETGEHYGLGDVRVVAGGISSIKMDKPLEGWVPDKIERIFYRPRKNKANTELIAAIDALPVVLLSDVNEVLKFKVHSEGNKMYFGLQYTIGFKDYALVYVKPEIKKYKPTEDMVEILASEYNELLKGE